MEWGAGEMGGGGWEGCMGQAAVHCVGRKVTNDALRGLDTRLPWVSCLGWVGGAMWLHGAARVPLSQQRLVYAYVHVSADKDWFQITCCPHFRVDAFSAGSAKQEMSRSGHRKPRQPRPEPTSKKNR